MRILITGATGYIGERLVTEARRQGHVVIAATRAKPPSTAIEWVAFDFATANTFQLPPDIDAVVHLAAVTRQSDVTADAEIAAGRCLAHACAKAGARLVFVSSQVARADAPTPYGQIKWAIEQIVETSGGVSVRPGQVYGGPARGLFGVLVHLVTALPVIPAFLPAPRIQPIHVDDLAKGILVALEQGAARGGVLCLGAPEPVSFTEFLQAIADHRVRRSKMRVPVPKFLVLLGVSLMGTTLAAKLGLDKLKSLFDLPAMDTRADLASIGLTLRPIDTGMTRSGSRRRRQLAQEGRALLSYVLRHAPEQGAIGRYVRAIETLRGGLPLDLPQTLLRHPCMIALIDTPATRNPSRAELGWRMNAALVIAESTPAGAVRFLGPDREAASRPVAATITVARAVGIAAAWQIARWFAKPFIQVRVPAPANPHDDARR